MRAPVNPIYQRALAELRAHRDLSRERLGIGSLLLARDMRAGLRITRHGNEHHNTKIEGNRAGLLSALIRHSFACFRDGCYELTQAGRDWLARVEKETRVFEILA